MGTINKTLVIIPVYNEEMSIKDVIDEIRKALPGSDVLVINDGSLDTSSEAAKSSGAMVLDLPCNLGIGVTVQTGLLFATERGYSVIVRLDADGQHSPEEIEGLIRPIRSGKADIVVGSRFLTNNAGYKSTFIRRKGIWFFSTLVSLIMWGHVTDPTSGFQAMNERVAKFFAEEYPPDYPEVEALILASKAGFTVGEVPVQMRERTSGQSSITFLSSVYYVLEVFISVVVSAFRKL